MIRDPAVLEALSYDPYPSAAGNVANVASFQSLIRKATGGVDPDLGNQNWGLGSAASTLLKDNWVPCADQTRCLDHAPFRLLAIAFRPDLADFLCGADKEGSDACGAEMHFEFGLISKNGGAPQGFQVIVEFAAPRLTKTGFRSMVKDWSTLADLAFSACKK